MPDPAGKASSSVSMVSRIKTTDERFLHHASQSGEFPFHSHGLTIWLTSISMPSTHFEIFTRAFAALDEHSRVLNGDHILCPPSEDSGYQSTPKNALTFAVMGVDGVHWAILKRDGVVRDDSPVVQVSPMDPDDVTVLAESLLCYLADGCSVSAEQMEAILEAERGGKTELVDFLSEHFDGSRLLAEERTNDLNARLGHLVERKVDDA